MRISVLSNGLSSWNSAIFVLIPTYTYTAVFATEDYARSNASWGNSKLDSIRSIIPEFEKLNNSQCIDRYIDNLKNGKNLVVVTDLLASSNNGSTLLGTSYYNNYPWQRDWICSSPSIVPALGRGGCTDESMEPFKSNWTVV